MSAAITGTASAPESREVELSIRGMTCAACAARVEKKLSALDDVSATVNFATETATVTVLASVPVARLIEAIEQAGYGADLAWAFGYNIAAIPLAAAGFLNPLIAGAAMAASSVFVVASSIRLRRFGTAGGTEPDEEGLPCPG